MIPFHNSSSFRDLKNFIASNYILHLRILVQKEMRERQGEFVIVL